VFLSTGCMSALSPKLAGQGDGGMLDEDDLDLDVGPGPVRPRGRYGSSGSGDDEDELGAPFRMDVEGQPRRAPRYGPPALSTYCPSD
jgi:hypothetical protein